MHARARLEQQRAVNGANEITGVTQGQGQTAWVTPAYDRAGNMTTLPKPSDPATALTAKYDAWNRLVEVREGENTIARYAHDGLGRLVVQATDASSPAEPDGTLDVYAHHFYAGVQPVETRDAATANAQPETLQPHYQYVWSARYIDAAIDAAIAAGGDKRVIWFWQLASPDKPLALPGVHPSGIGLLRWLDGGRTLVSGSGSETHVRGIPTGEIVRTISGDAGDVWTQRRVLFSRGASMIRLWNLDDGRALPCVLALGEGRYAAINPEGHYRAPPKVEKELVYVVLTDSGEQITLTPEEFANKYAWKNDPAKVQSGSSTPAARPQQRPQVPTAPSTRQSAPIRGPERAGPALRLVFDSLWPSKKGTIHRHDSVLPRVQRP